MRPVFLSAAPLLHPFYAAMRFFRAEAWRGLLLLRLFYWFRLLVCWHNFCNLYVQAHAVLHL